MPQAQPNTNGLMPAPLAEAELQNYFYIHHHQKYSVVAVNTYVGGYEFDILGIRANGYVDEIEIKLSQSDFVHDFKKSQLGISKHRLLKEGGLLPNYFSFLFPENTVDTQQVPLHLGIYIAKGQTVVQIRRPKRLHKCKIDDKLKYDVARRVTYKYWRGRCHLKDAQ